MSRSEIPEMDVIITKHAMDRMRSRGCAPIFIKLYLQRIRRVYLLKSKRDYMIYIPFKGWLIGIVEGNKFIIKTFLLPIYGKTGMPSDTSIIIKQVSFPE